MIRSLLCICLMLAGWSQEFPGTNPVPRALAHTIGQLVEAQAHVQSTCSAAAITVPNGLTDVLIVRRTIAADWQKRLESGAVQPNDAGLARFTTELESLVSGLQQLANLAQQLGDAPRRFPHCLSEPAYTRYRTMVADAVAQGMQSVSAGRLRDQVAPATWFQKQSRHTTLLTLIEAGHVADERYAALVRDDQWLIEYREHLLLTRTTLERTLELPDDHDSWRQQAILESYTRLLDARVHLAERIVECELPLDAPEVATFRRAGEAQITVLGRLVVLARSSDTDQDDQSLREQRENHVLSQTERLKDMAEQWLSFEQQRREQVENTTATLAEAPATLAQAHRAAFDGIATALRSAQQQFDQAVSASDLTAALAAHQAAQRIRQQSERLWLHLDEDLAIAEREQSWRAHSKDPAIAEKLRQWDERRAAALAARVAAEEAADAALTASQAAERAQLVSEQAQERAEQLQGIEEHHDLSELIDALDEMVDLRAGTVPAP